MIGCVAFPIGSRVLYRGCWGAFAPVRGTITGYGEKNGRALCDVLLDDGSRRWGYLDQFELLPRLR